MMKISKMLIVWMTFFCFISVPGMLHAADTKAAVAKTEPAGAKSIKWVSYNEAVSSGQEQSKKVFTTFYANWCGYCKKMDRETFSDAAVIEYMNNNFISAKVNTEKEKTLASKFRISGLPTHMFLLENGSPIATVPGYIDTNKFLHLLKYVNTESYKNMKLQDFIASEKQPEKKPDKESVKK